MREANRTKNDHSSAAAHHAGAQTVVQRSKFMQQCRDFLWHKICFDVNKANGGLNFGAERNRTPKVSTGQRRPSL
ncbi:MAG: hypothetical protein H6951_03140 [Zoogloeaceae bacterium]|nr:hypothetical protein [Zoogloeaceae bacterium]